VPHSRLPTRERRYIPPEDALDGPEGNSGASGSRRRPGRPRAAMPVGELDTRELILRHARRLFLQRGYADVAVGEIASAVGVTKPTLYYHFGGKEGLYAAVLVHLLREIGGYIRGCAEKSAPVRARLNEIAFGYFLNANGTTEPLLRDASHLIGAEHAEQVWACYENDFLRPLVELMRQGIETGEIRRSDPRGLARGFMGLLESFTAPGGHHTRTPVEHRTVAEDVVSLFVDGAAPRG
jgi:AcrR family transcriptional regulator